MVTAMMIFKNSGQRVDSVFGMRLDEFIYGRWVDGMWVIRVKEHKVILC